MPETASGLRLPFWKRALFVAILVGGPLLAAEFLLYKIDFTYQPRNRRMRFAFPDEKSLHEIYQPSPTTLWALRPGFNFPEAKIEGVNALGLRGPMPNPQSCRRVLMLGDSVVFGGETSIAHELEAIWRDSPPAGLDCPVQVLNAGVPGFSSWQGLRWLEQNGAALKPDLVVVLFGWNDHWQAQGYPDKDQRVRGERALALENFLLKIKIYQLLCRIIESSGSSERAQGQGGQPRVSLEDYRSNMAGMVGWCREHGCRTVLLTSPVAETGATPHYLYSGGFLSQEEDVRQLHSLYNEQILSLAPESPVLDLSPALAGHPVGEVFNAPDKDIIHPNTKGYRLIAESLANSLAPLLASKAAQHP